MSRMRSTAGIENRVPPQLSSTQQALERHWDFLYARARPDADAASPGVKFAQRRSAAADKGVDMALRMLEQKKQLGPGSKALVMGGGYEVNLDALLEKCGEVHVVDMNAGPLEVVRAKYANHPQAAKLRFITADLSGISEDTQEKALRSLHRSKVPCTPDAFDAYFAEVPSNLVELPFDSGAYSIVVSPVLNESLPYSPVVDAFESERVAAEKRGAELPRKAVDDALGEEYFYKPEVRTAFHSVLDHHGSELRRLLRDGGMAVFTSWMRQDEHQPALAPGEDRTLLRVGDSRLLKDDWHDFFDAWGRTRTVVSQEALYQPEMPSMKARMNVYVLEK